MTKAEARTAIYEHCGAPSFTKGEARLLEVIVSRTRVNTRNWRDQQVEESKCSSSVSSLARAARLSQERVMRYLRHLKAEKLVEVRKGTGGKGQDEYTATCAPLLNMPFIPKPKPSTGRERQRKHRGKIRAIRDELEALRKSMSEKSMLVNREEAL
jgi:hypothetical protein